MPPRSQIDVTPTVPQVLREYALLADGERGILVGPRGDFAWLCFPGWADEAVFSSLIGGQVNTLRLERRFDPHPRDRDARAHAQLRGAVRAHPSWLQPDGRFFCHLFAHREHGYTYNSG